MNYVLMRDLKDNQIHHIESASGTGAIVKTSQTKECRAVSEIGPRGVSKQADPQVSQTGRFAGSCFPLLCDRRSGEITAVCCTTQHTPEIVSTPEQQEQEDRCENTV